MKKIIPLILILCLFFSGCGSKKVTETVFAMDTVMTLTVYDKGAVADLALSDSKKELFRLEKLLSVTDPESEIYQMNHGNTDALNEAYGLLIQALSFSVETGGCYDPTVYALMELWGFYDDEFSVPTEEVLQEALAHTGYGKADVVPGLCKVHLPQGMGIDLGGIAKGYAAQNVLQIMQSHMVDAAVISLGGNVGLMGQKPDGSDWTVAVEKPDGSGESVATMTIPGGEKNTYVVTSGAYQRYFEVDGVRYHHILDPETGIPAETDLLSVTIISENGTEADALSTALFVMGFEEAVSYWRSHSEEISVVLITEEGLFASEGIAIASELPITTLEVRS